MYVLFLIVLGLGIVEFFIKFVLIVVIFNNNVYKIEKNNFLVLFLVRNFFD